VTGGILAVLGTGGPYRLVELLAGAPDRMHKGFF
jgi:hypothetical protein